jgi:hypothetical protein
MSALPLKEEAEKFTNGLFGGYPMLRSAGELPS